jgi:hypothetical protein
MSIIAFLLSDHGTFLSSSLVESIHWSTRLARLFEDVLLMMVDGGCQSLNIILQILLL